MTDGAYLFRQTASERKRIGRGAFSKKNGSKSRACRLSTDYLTECQLKKRSGDVKVYRLGEPMGWEEFRSLPADLKREYISKSVERGATVKDIADMFGVSSKRLRNYLRYQFKGESFFGKGHRGNRDDWEAWCAQFPSMSPAGPDTFQAPIPTVLPVPAPAEPPAAEGDAPPLSGTLRYECDLRAAFDSILKLLDASKRYAVEFRFEECRPIGNGD